MSGSGYPDLVRRTAHVLRADPSRVVSRLFLPGQELLATGQSRSAAVLERILNLDEEQVSRALSEVTASFAHRHRDLGATLEARFGLVEHRLEDPRSLSAARRRLVGAYFSQEYAVEGAALFNPSMVAHPDQGGLPPGATRFVMSARAVGEGHISSIEFRTGTVDGDDVRFDDPVGTTELPRPVETTYSTAVFARQHATLGGDQSSADFVLDSLPPLFTRADLDRALALLTGQRLTRRSAARTVERFEWIAACNYSVTFPDDTVLDERIIMPGSPSEDRGLEDVRLVRFTDDDGTVDYRGTYTAYNGASVASQLLRTDDFKTFHLSQLSGPAAKDKGMALFPRPVGGRYAALSRGDRETNGVVFSDDFGHWTGSSTLQRPAQPWEVVQLGNCGPPIETEHGWLVLTHGVGPMRVYSIGAMLLDLDDPRRVLAHLPEPLLTPTAEEREGYVPNVVYSCGALRSADTLVLPYGCSDAAIRVALVDLPGLLATLLAMRTDR